MLRLTGLAAGLSLALAGAASAQDITIGVAGPLTGQYASFGQQFKNGATMAIADINAAGGVLGKKLKMDIQDDACDPKQARSVAEKLVGANVPVVIGHFCSGSSIPASDVYADAGVIEITPASTNPKFTERGMWNLFRVCGRDDQQGQVAGEYIATHYKGKNIAIVHDKQTYSQGLADEIKKTLNKAGVKIKMMEAYGKDDKDFNALVSRMKADSIDVVYVGGYHTSAGPDAAADAGARAEGADDLGRRHRHRRVLVDHRRRRHRHDVHLRPRPAQAPDRRRRGEALQGQGHQSGGLYALHLRRHPDLGGGRQEGQDHRSQEGRGRDPQAASGTPCWARSPTTRRATSPSSTTCSTAGRRTANTSRWSKRSALPRIREARRPPRRAFLCARAQPILPSTGNVSSSHTLI